MECNINKVMAIYDSIINTYTNRGFKAKYTFSTFSPSCTLSKDDLSVKVIMNYTSEKIPGFEFSISCIKIQVQDVCGIISTVNTFYYLGDSGYTTELSKVKESRDKHLSRFLNMTSNSHSVTYLNVKKLPDRSINYLKSRIASRLKAEDRSNDFKIINVYYTYSKQLTERELVVVIKHSDHFATEAFYL